MATPSTPPADLPRRRLLNQQLLRPRLRSPAELVAWFGAVQAQDYLGSLWAVGQRLAQATEADVERALAERTLVRTWPMRGTLHYVAAGDVRWMLALCTPRVIARSAGRHRQLGLDEAAFRRGAAALARELEGGRQLARREAYAALERGGVSPAGQRGLHVIGYLAQRGLICFGPRQGRQPTFVLLDEWLPAAAAVPREEALARLAGRYFASHGPATVHDFAWWSGLPVKDALAGIEGAGPRLVVPDGDGRRWRSAAEPPSRAARSPVASLLTSWDEYLVAYQDRDALVPHRRGRENRLQTVGGA
ncbi:MAG TPA: winged helix DNA-binding domain-containing protein, partial [Vicinamibacteria bacterium]